jgi:hypothetical protein
MTNASINNVAAFTAAPWLLTSKGAAYQHLLLSAEQLRSAGIVALPLIDSHRVILAARAHAQWISDMGPWRLRGDIVRDSGHGLYDLYQSYLMIRAWCRDYA